MSQYRKIRYPVLGSMALPISLISPVPSVPRKSPNDQPSKPVNRKRPKNKPGEDEPVLHISADSRTGVLIPPAALLSTVVRSFNVNSPACGLQKTPVGIPAKRQKICRTDSDKKKSTNTPKPNLQTPINLSSNKKTPTNTPKYSLVNPINLSAKPSGSGIKIKVKKVDDNKSDTKTTLEDKLKILMLSLKYGLEKKYSFAFATGMDSEADNIVFQYKEPNGRLVYRFLRVTHETRINKVISMDDLLADNYEKFSLQRHFFSYCEILKNPLFENFKMKDYVICTNIGMENTLKNNYFTPITGNDKILSFEQADTERLKLKFDEFPKKNELFSLLRKTSTCNRLAKQLAKYITHGEVIDLQDDLFKLYHRALRRYVIEPENIQDTKGKIISAKFNKSFLEGHLPEQAKKFRTAFYEAYQDISNQSVDKVQFWQTMKIVRPKMSHCFEAVIELDDDLRHTECKKLAEEIAEEMRSHNGDSVGLDRRTLVMKKNIDKLAGYVFIKKDTMEKDTYYFNSKFFKNEYKLPNNLQNFKNNLIEELRKRNVPFGKHEYKFRIRDFKTCVEAVVYSEPYLPDDNKDDKIPETEIGDFFEKLVFVINQPHGIKLDQIYTKKMSKYYNSSFDKTISCSLQKEILEWIKANQGRFQTLKEGNDFFKMIENVIFKLVENKVHESTFKYLKSFESFASSFIDVPPELHSFLNSKQEQIFNFISSLDTTLVQASKKNPENNSESSLATTLSAIKVMQALNSTYQIKNPYIFMDLKSILPLRDHVLDAFSSEVSNHLLVIECGNGKANFWKLYQRLCSIIEHRPNKKIILITERNDILAEAFRGFFSENQNTYKEIKDKK